MGFEINLIFLIKPFFLHDQKVNEESFQGEIRRIFHHL